MDKSNVCFFPSQEIVWVFIFLVECRSIQNIQATFISDFEESGSPDFVVLQIVMFSFVAIDKVNGLVFIGYRIQDDVILLICI